MNLSKGNCQPIKIKEIALVILALVHSLVIIPIIIHHVQGRDGNISSVKILVNGSYYERPHRKLIILKVTDKENDDLVC